MSVPSTRTIRRALSRSTSLSTTYAAPCSPNDLHGDNIMHKFRENFSTHSLRPLYDYNRWLSGYVHTTYTPSARASTAVHAASHTRSVVSSKAHALCGC